MPELRRQVNILYVGSDDPNDTTGMLYYLRQAFGTGKALTSHIVPRPGSEILSPPDIDAAHLIVVTDTLNPQNITALRRYLESGKPLLLALKSAEAGAALSGLAGVGKIELQEAQTSRYAMLGRLEFDHPLLKPFSDPRFGDFTRIHFWKYRQIDLAACPAARVLARFDNNDPAWFEIPVGRGTLLVWTSGWQPADSDLALSSKFVPLLYGTLEYGGTLTEHPSQYFVGDAVPIDSQMAAGGWGRSNSQARRFHGALSQGPANLHSNGPSRNLFDCEFGARHKSAILRHQPAGGGKPDGPHARRGLGETRRHAEACRPRGIGGGPASGPSQQLHRDGVPAEALAMGAHGDVGGLTDRDWAGRMAHSLRSAT